ncbi:MAG: M3 family oligoendopeptidase [Candidatus Eisenbacteria bacterium]
MADVKVALPHWDLSNVYGGLDAADFRADVDKFKRDLDKLETYLKEHGIGKLDALPPDAAATGKALDGVIDLLNGTLRTMSTLNAYIYSFVSTDSRNTLAAKRQSELEQLRVRFQKVYVPFEAWVGSLAPMLDKIVESAPRAKEHHGALKDIADDSRFRMSAEMEALASELVVSGGGIMDKLQERVTSQLKMPFERDGKTEELPMPVLRNLANDADPDVRKRAYDVEIEGWTSIREPVAFALNGVKGTAVTLAKRRGYDDVLHGSLELNKMDRGTLDALTGSMKDSFPTFRRYLQSKAGKLGKGKLPWWDMFAPVGKVELKYSWDELVAFVIEQFGTFSGELADYAKNAFENDWIDAEPREGKIGGAFCMRVPKVDESRIMCNFDGSFDQLSTVSHELGHGFHNYCQIGLPMIRAGSPMTLAETASIFCETLVTNAALETAAPEAQLGILENQLSNASQVIVDIYSRFIFEGEVVRRRADAELSADDFCDIMIDAQKQTYGDGLDMDHLHPYMWLLKPHYYMYDYNFYNFPYAFGLLFGLGVYALYKKEGEAFIPRYKELLRSTGEGKAADLAAKYGIDIRSRDFWKGSIGVLAKQVDRYCELDG